jgi:hypothetical protein
MTGRIALLAFVATATAAGAPGEVVRVEHHDPNALPSRGPANALVTIEMFFTPGAGSHTSAFRYLQKLQAQHPARIRLIYRVLAGNGTVRLPYAALEAHAEGKFFEFMTELENELYPPPPKAPIQLNDQALLDLGRNIGIDPQRLALAITKPPEAYQKLLESSDRRRRRKIHGGSLPNALFNGQPPKTQLSALGPNDLEAEYLRARDLAFDLLDRGIDPRPKIDAIDPTSAPNPSELTIQAGEIEEELDTVSSEPLLATPPLQLEGLPSYGPADAAVTIVVLCSPTSSRCRGPLSTARNTQDIYPQSVRVVWAPIFDVNRDDAADLSQLGDAAFCAEKTGTTSDRDELIETASPGWLWIDRVRDEANNRRRRLPVEQLIDRVADKLKVDRRSFADCRARLAGTTVTWIEAARHAGVHTSPATVVGGRIYPPIADPNTLQMLVEGELAPGIIDTYLPTRPTVR